MKKTKNMNDPIEVIIMLLANPDTQREYVTTLINEIAENAFNAARETKYVNGPPSEFNLTKLLYDGEHIQSYPTFKDYLKKIQK